MADIGTPRSLESLGRAADFDLWANRAALASLSTADTERGRTILGHVHDGVAFWLAQIDGGPLPDNRWEPRSLDALQALVDQAGRMMRRVIQSSDEEGLSRAVSIRDREGRASASYTVGDIIRHLLVHSAEHRGQISDEVGQAGGTAADTGFLRYVASSR
jgi:uncharacterized damage-inducible protein DinB